MNVLSSASFTSAFSTSPPVTHPTAAVGEQDPAAQNSSVKQASESAPQNFKEDHEHAEHDSAAKQQDKQDQKIVAELAARDREVRAHEQAHASVGGAVAGAPSYTLEKAPNGVSYAVGGEVSISTSAVANNPEATIRKADTVRRAALAPADPSAQDRSVAAQATKMKIQAQVELTSRAQEATATDSDNSNQAQRGVSDDSAGGSISESNLQPDLTGFLERNLMTEQVVGGSNEAARTVDELL